MKRSYRGVLLLCVVLMLNIIFTQKAVHQYYFENYEQTIIYALLNILMFPIALFIYKKEKGNGASKEEKR
ncbi:hypothetical protein [Caldalkalibacillus mannanilyticus]|uniref:hypothetical protein n=1 Tax=Caldalkalibacillus mannanilyticus TaxID=1418 RepID=UPI00046AFF32|nr:hypothetical protein [Caldalkalibacillus mannanilyticus]